MAKKAVEQIASDIVMLPIAELSISSKNPRAIDDNAFLALKQSITKDPGFMYSRPILVNRVNGNNVIYAGAQRYTACLELGWSDVPCIVDENLSQPELDFRMLADNTHNGEWDEQKLLAGFSDVLPDVHINKNIFSDIKPARKQKPVGVSYTRLNFQNDEERVIWGLFLQDLNLQYPEYPIAERLRLYLSEVYQAGADVN